MAEHAHDDVVEQILLRSDVKDLIRFKSVCKSWHCLITSRRFIDHHLNISYNKDRYNSEHTHRRIILAQYFVRYYEHEHFLLQNLVGTSNGLVCIFSFFVFKILIGNPMSREVRQLKLPQYGLPVCYGFGYDSSTDDYKVIIGTWKSLNSSCLRVLRLKSGVWRVIKQTKYVFDRKDGVLY
ncbi:hypothetical protein QVD17_01073 [Tagetes erecta]|uniref:F-box domain-containing protein n=1 Tax=Tagetes erecta TaxID=13708 RepID=A0AAD8LBG6_TARER|nr:hypothetical protein QVD17_01073 [Tagetes erecta]